MHGFLTLVFIQKL